MTANDNDIKVWSKEKADYEMIVEKAKHYSHSDLLPPAFKDKPANVLIALEISKELGINPLTVMQNIYIIHGRPSFSGSFILALIYKSKEFKNIEFCFVDKPSLGCYIKAKRVFDDDLVEGPLINMDLAKAEGWLQKAGSKWKTMPEIMLRYRAAAAFCRTCAPHLLFGLYSTDEVADFMSASSSSVQATPGSEPVSDPVPVPEKRKKTKANSRFQKTIQDILKEYQTDEDDDGE